MTQHSAPNRRQFKEMNLPVWEHIHSWDVKGPYLYKKYVLLCSFNTVYCSYSKVQVFV